VKQETTWGVAAVLAIATMVGISTQSSRTTGEGSAKGAVTVNGGQPPRPHKPSPKPGRACSDAEKLLQEYLLTQKDSIAAPLVCFEGGPSPDADSKLRDRASHLKFVIATLPDPLHTHFSLLFDRNAEAIQQAAQDDGYVYDSSWLPWETEEQPLITLADQDSADDRKEAREEQPGLILFRKSTDKKSPADKALGTTQAFDDGLAVFIVGEEATRGIHRRQFENAAAWISSLRQPNADPSPVGILGPTFSGSFPSLAELLVDESVHESLKFQPADKRPPGWQTRVYSGSVSGRSAVEWFASVAANDPRLAGWGISFHSFQNSDDTVLDSYCRYLDQVGLDVSKLAVISEDETAYGFSGIGPDQAQVQKSEAKKPEAQKKINDPCREALSLYYPRDISALRAAYQTQSIFSSSSSQPSPDAQRRNLPSDLADPEGEAHDTIRSYGGNQTPLSQEAGLMGIVSVLREHRAQYLVLRSSNTLDPLFLAKFLRAAYPAGRVVILGSDLLFQRERGSGGIGGVMLLSTYPLFAWEQNWTNWPRAREESSHRVFTEDLVEGTYNAARFLLHDPPVLDNTPNNDPKSTLKCSSENVEPCFLPVNLKATEFPVPDYAAPFWIVPDNCKAAVAQGETLNPLCAGYLRPAIWLSVLGRGDFYPLAAFHKEEAPDDANLPRVQADLKSSAKPIPGPRPQGMPLGMKLCLIFILGLAAFHATCCWKASFTAKPAFRAHFATTRDAHRCGPWRQPALIVIGSTLLMFMATVAAWGCGAFSGAGGLLGRQWLVRAFLLVAFCGALSSILTNNRAIRRLEKDKINDESRAGWPAMSPKEWKRSLKWLRWRTAWSCLALLIAVAAFYGTFVHLIEMVLQLGSRIPTYWRSMNINSGVSPITPFLWLFGGLYAWFWYSLHGLALFGIDRPRLPSRSNLKLKEMSGIDPHVLRMFSQEEAAERTEGTAMPLARDTLWIAVILALLFGGSAFVLSPRAPIRSLGANRYAYIFCAWLDICFSLMLAEAWQLLQTWSALRQLLVFLDRLPIRRTLAALRGFSWGSVWKMSGNVLDVRYKLLSRQLESLNHLSAAFDDLPKNSDQALAAQGCEPAMNAALSARNRFAGWYSEKYRDPDAGNFKDLQAFQKSVAALAGKLITDVLAPAWRKETASLVLAAGDSPDDEPATPEKVPLAQVEEHIRNAEELVCLPYLGFVQNILGRMRTLVLGIACLFVAVTLSVSSYPFDPRQALSGTLIILFVALAVIISFVYADMHRDATLSHVTKTNPGQLGTEFWLKLIGFGAGPILGLLTTVFPGLADFLFSWLQPGLASLK
jgi:hypothetical protein